MNFVAVLIAAVIPTVIGFVWYNPKTFAPVWMRESGVDEVKIKTGNMAVIFGVSLLFSLMIAFFEQILVIHQLHFGSILAMQPDFKEAGSVSSELMKQLTDLYSHSFRTFKHGVFHGVLASIFFVLPIIGINSLFERRSFKYIMIHFGYWMVTLGIMGGILCGME